MVGPIAFWTGALITGTLGYGGLRYYRKQQRTWETDSLDPAVAQVDGVAVELTGRQVTGSLGECGGVRLSTGERSEEDAQTAAYTALPRLLPQIQTRYRDYDPDGYLLAVTFTDRSSDEASDQDRTRYVLLSNGAAETITEQRRPTALDVECVVKNDPPSRSWERTRPERASPDEHSDERDGGMPRINSGMGAN